MSKKLILLFIFFMMAHAGRSQQLKGVTFGFAAGYHYNFSTTSNYFLAVDDNYKLKISDNQRGAFVISSMINIKSKKIFKTKAGLKKIVDSNAVDEKFEIKNGKTSITTTIPLTELGPCERITYHVGLNLVDITNNVSFNKQIDGGLGIGYLVNDDIHIALMADVARVKQIRGYYAEKYKDQPIPNGTSFYNALDTTDKNLFEDKTTFGVSLKVVFSL